jgi:4-hydroxythreonine-4-phosphate dehydrogenase
MMRIGITLGDVTGIGPEVTLKALAGELPADDSCNYVILGNSEILLAEAEQLGISLPLGEARSGSALVEISEGGSQASLRDLAPGAPEAARAAVQWLTVGAQMCLRGELNALVTAPVSKETIIRSGQPFLGQTEFLSELAGTDRTAMMLLGADDRGRWLRVVLATTHVPIREVAERITHAKVALAIELAARACADLQLNRARIGVCGLNPHSGEGGHFGSEEIDIIVPAVEAARRQGIEVAGPLAADTLFHRAYRGEFEIVVAMYHDQGLAPLKMVAFANGVNWTLGLPFIRTSPDHGTAYDLAGKGLADASSMAAAIRLAKQLAQATT